MSENSWRLGNDLVLSDNLLDELTFDELIASVCSNCQEITKTAVYEELSRMLAIRKQGYDNSAGKQHGYDHGRG